MSRHHKEGALWAAGSLLSALALAWMLAPDRQAGVQRIRFSTYSDSTIETLRVEYHGGLGGSPSRFVLFGDGRLVGDSFELQLSEAETERVVRTVIDSEVLEAPSYRQMSPGKSLENHGRTSLDSILLTVYLDRYKTKNGSISSPFVRRVEVLDTVGGGDREGPARQSSGFTAVTQLLLEARDVAAERSQWTSKPPRQVSFEEFSSHRRYTFSDRDQTEVLRIEHRGGDSTRWGLFQLFGDGRLVLGVTDSKPEHRVVESYEVMISRTDMEQLLDPLVHSGFVESDDDRIYRQIGGRQTFFPPRRPVGNTKSTTIVLRLSSYTDLHGEQRGEIIARLRVPSPHGLARAFPSIAELQGIANTHHALVDIGLRIRDRVLSDDPLFSPSTESNGPETERASLRLSDDGSAPLIRLTMFASDSARRQIYTLFGDGRLEERHKELGSNGAFVTVALPQQTVRDLVRSAIRGGLLTTSQTELWSSIQENLQDRNRLLEQEGKPLIVGPISNADSTSSIEIRVDRFGRLGGRSNRLTLLDLEAHYRAFPQISELEAWSDLIATMQRLVQGSS